jgi:hypothetical protein
MAQEIDFSTGVPADIYGFHPYTSSSVSLYQPQVEQFPMQFHS